MSTKTIYRLSGLAGMIGGGVIVLFVILQIAGLVPPVIDTARGLITLFLWIFAMLGIYGKEHRKAGVLGLVGFVLAIIALVMNVCFRYTALFFVPVLSAGFPEAMTAVFSGPINTAIMAVFWLFVIGFTCLGIATLRAGVFPRWASWLILIGPLATFLGSIAMLNLASQIGTMLTGLALIGFGLALWKEDGELAVVTGMEASPA